MAGGVTQSYDRLAAILDVDKVDGDKTAWTAPQRKRA